MNKQLAILLAGMIGTPGYLDSICGLAQVATSQIPGEGDKMITKRFPVSSFTTAEQCASKTADLYALIPDSKKKGILYFEENGPISPVEKKTSGQVYQSRLRVICWINPERITTASNKSTVGVAIMNDIIKKLTAQSFFHDTTNKLFSSVLVQIESIPPTSPLLFSKYDYSEANTQFLMHPYDYFGIDLSVQYMVPFSCINNYSPTAPTTPVC
ncbi:MAG TPA: hypothetical protein VJ552_05335 [Sediminibacterium sp.]|nr:hypothetical protein [Sediminibacterium sp.]